MSDKFVGCVCPESSAPSAPCREPRRPSSSSSRTAWTSPGWTSPTGRRSINFLWQKLCEDKILLKDSLERFLNIFLRWTYFYLPPSFMLYHKRRINMGDRLNQKQFHIYVRVFVPPRRCLRLSAPLDLGYHLYLSLMYAASLGAFASIGLFFILVLNANFVQVPRVPRRHHRQLQDRRQDVQGNYSHTCFFLLYEDEDLFPHLLFISH